MEKQVLHYYAGDQFSSGVWEGKYALKNEKTPDDMHWRMTYKLGEIEHEYWTKDKLHKDLSDFGKKLYNELGSSDPEYINGWIFKYLNRYKYIIPQGSIMAMLGNTEAIGSLANCFTIPSPADSYGGIFKADQQIAQLQKRRGGVGTNLNTLRPEGSKVLNAASTSTGAHSFADRFSNTTREVAQGGRK